jgi:phospholipid/cholesterol/gamma-HCH transport system permease protein
MRALGTDPTRRLVTPRMIATVMMLPILTILCNAVGMIGGWIIARYKLLLSSSQYWSDSLNALELSDVFGTLLKPVVFGFIISMTGCYVGLRTYGGTEGVGRSTTQAVVSASILVITVDFFLNNLIIFLTPFINR